MKLYGFAFNLNRGSLTKYFLKYFSQMLLLFKVKAMHHGTNDDDIAIRDHDTCIE